MKIITFLLIGTTLFGRLFNLVNKLRIIQLDPNKTFYNHFTKKNRYYNILKRRPFSVTCSVSNNTSRIISSSIERKLFYFEIFNHLFKCNNYPGKLIAQGNVSEKMLAMKRFINSIMYKVKQPILKPILTCSAYITL